MRYSQLAVLCASLALFFSGCIFSPKRGGGGGPPPPSAYLPPILPEYVMENLAGAYAKRDSAKYKSLFDSLYTGTSLDQTDPSPQLLIYTKADEAQHIAGLAKSTKITSVDLQLVPRLVRSTDAGDPPGWAVIQNPIASLVITEPPDGGYSIVPTDETLEFHFIPKTPDSSSPTDTTWKIVRWVEVRR